MKFLVWQGVFEGHVFNGTPIFIDNERRIWDNDSLGRSYPSENCISIGESEKPCPFVFSKTVTYNAV